MENYTLAIHSANRVTGTPYAYTVLLPFMTNDIPYKCTMQLIASGVDTSTDYSLTVKSPTVTRALNTSDGASNTAVICVFNGVQQSTAGVVYFNSAPVSLDIAFHVISTAAAAVDMTEHMILCHFEKL